MKKLIIGATVVALTAGVSMAANIEYAGSGNWTNYVYDTPGTGWNVAAPQTISTNTARVSGSRVVTVTTTENVAGIQLAVGSSGTLIIDNGGALTSTNNSTVGNNGNGAVGTLTIKNGGVYTNAANKWFQVANGANENNGIVNIEAGGVMGLSSHLWLASSTNTLAVGTVNLAGTLTVGGDFALGSLNGSAARGSTGFLNMIDGGKMILNRAYDSAIIFGNSKIDFTLADTTAYIQYNGNGAALVQADIDAGRIIGAVTFYDAGLNKTLITVPEPATIGMLGLGAMAVLGIRRLRRRA